MIWGDKANRIGFHAVNFLEDCRISHPAILGTRPASVKADAIEVALKDLGESEATLSDPNIHTDPFRYNGALGIALRSLSLLNATGYEDQVGILSWPMVKNKKLCRTANALIRIAKLIHECPIEPRPVSSFRECDRIAKRRRTYLQPALDLFASMQLAPLPREDSSMEAPVSPMDDDSTNEAMARVKFARLPLAVDTMAHQRNITRYPAMTGPRLRAASLVPLALGIPGQHFIRRTIQPSANGGAVMIDASGSMSFSQATLEDLSSKIPAGFIAYYCASSEEAGGVITIYADNGRRALSMPPRTGNGNACDYAALLTLLNRPEAPKILVTDKGFCGGPASDIARAFAIMEREENTGRLLVLPRLPMAVEYLTGKLTLEQIKAGGEE